MFVVLMAFWISIIMLAYTMVIYPLLMRMVARLCYRPSPLADNDSASLPRVSLIVPAHNEEDVLVAKLTNACELDYPADRLEIIVANDASTDRTSEIARSFNDPRLRLLDSTTRRGKPETVNRAIREATGEILCLCDANVMFRRDALRTLVARLGDPRVGAVSADVRIASDESDFGQGETTYYGMERAIQLGESCWGSTQGVDGGMYVIRRSLYESVPADTIIDDFVISMNVIRQGKRVIYEPRAIAHENGTPSVAEEFRRRVRVSAGAMQALRRRNWPGVTQPLAFFQFCSHKLLRWFGPVWLIGLLISSGVLAFASGVPVGYSIAGYSTQWLLQILFFAQLFVYLLAAMATFHIGLRATRVGGVAFYFTMSHVAMLVGLIQGLTTRQSGVWERTSRKSFHANHANPTPEQVKA